MSKELVNEDIFVCSTTSYSFHLHKEIKEKNFSFSSRPMSYITYRLVAYDNKTNALVDLEDKYPIYEDLLIGVLSDSKEELIKTNEKEAVIYDENNRILERFDGFKRYLENIIKYELNDLPCDPDYEDEYEKYDNIIHKLNLDELYIYFNDEEREMIFAEEHPEEYAAYKEACKETYEEACKEIEMKMAAEMTEINEKAEI